MRMKKYPKYTALMITWRDIVSDSAWHNQDELDKAETAVIQTVGFFLQNKKKELKVGHSVTDDCHCDYTIIPWSNIVAVKELHHKETEE